MTAQQEHLRQRQAEYQQQQAAQQADNTQRTLAALAAVLCYNPYKPAIPHPMAKCGVWELFIDPDSQAQYYSNCESGESSWDTPAEWDEAQAYVPALAKFNNWEVYRDPNSLMEYYNNLETGQVSWEPPPELAAKVHKVSAADAALVGQYYEVMHAAAAGQPAGGGGEAGGMEEPAAAQPEARVGDWEVYTDAASGHLYYFNPVTQVTQWEAPAAIMDADHTAWDAQVPEEVTVVMELADIEDDDDLNAEGGDFFSLLTVGPPSLVAAEERRKRRISRMSVASEVHEDNTTTAVTATSSPGGGAAAAVASDERRTSRVARLRRNTSHASELSDSVSAMPAAGSAAGSATGGDDMVMALPPGAVGSPSHRHSSASVPPIEIRTQPSPKPSPKPSNTGKKGPPKAPVQRKFWEDDQPTGTKSTKSKRSVPTGKGAPKPPAQRNFWEEDGDKGKGKDQEDSSDDEYSDDSDHEETPGGVTISKPSGMAAMNALEKAQGGKGGDKGAVATRPSLGAKQASIGRGTNLLLQMRGAPVPPKADSKEQEGDKAKEAQKLPIWLQRQPKPPKSPPRPKPIKLTGSVGLSYRPPMFSSGAYSFAPRVKAPPPKPAGNPEDAKAKAKADAAAAAAAAAATAAGSSGEGEGKQGGDEAPKSGPAAPSSPKKAANGDAQADDDWVRQRIKEVQESKAKDTDTTKAELSRLVTSHGMTEQEARAFLRFKKNRESEGIDEGWAGQYQAFLNKQRESAEAELKARRAEMGERIAQLEELKLKKEVERRQRLANDMAEWEERKNKRAEEVAAKRKAAAEAEAAREAAEAEARRSKFLGKKAARARKKKEAAEREEAKRRAIREEKARIARERAEKQRAEEERIKVRVCVS